MGCQKGLLSLLLNNLIDIPLFKMSLIFTPGVIFKAPNAIASIGGGDLIRSIETKFRSHFFISGIWVPPPTNTIESKSSILQKFPLASFNNSLIRVFK